MKALETLGKIRKKANNKGFTLVELIVVIVILAILAAILVPALLGYIDRAKGSGVLLSAKSFMTAAQAELSNAYGTASGTATVTSMMDTTRRGNIKTTADVTGQGSFNTGADVDDGKATPKNHAAWTISEVWYKENGILVHYKDGEWINPETSGDWDTGIYDVE